VRIAQGGCRFLPPSTLPLYPRCPGCGLTLLNGRLVTAGQYFYAVGLGKGWQIASGPNFSYNWLADSDQALTLPVGIGVAKTTKLGSTPVKFQVQVQYFVEQPDAFGPEWLLKFSMTPVIKNLFARN
jgi:hypothetical protein